MKYQTIQYADLFDRLASGDRLSQAMLQTLLAEHRRETAARVPAGTAPATTPAGSTPPATQE
ncbi:hypothetical protein [Lignipirellula cremea]|uniref:hypothetical protein n=1 Tax=Lignipirellula cremea TaxID=2528010 RepID=UPI0018D2399E|nr:hypothetical protein [Lignipirellula cremea]